MTTLVFTGGGSDLPSDLAQQLEGVDVLVVVAAAAFERPDAVAVQCEAALQAVGATATLSDLRSRADAHDRAIVDQLTAATAVWLSDGSPMHLRNVLKDTPAWEAIASVPARGGVLMCSGAAASVATDPMFDARGGAFTLGLGLVSSMAVMTGHEGWTPARSRRVHQLAPSAATIVGLDTGAAVMWRDGVWSSFGVVTVERDGTVLTVSDLPVVEIS
jgi:cyanophycinase